MKNPEGRQLIVKMQKDLLKFGIVADNLVRDLQALRPYAVAEENPTLTKVIRLCYEHLQKSNNFNIAIPADEAIDGEEPAPIKTVIDNDDFEAKRESLNYLLAVMLDDDNKSNREDLVAYRDALMAYAADN